MSDYFDVPIKGVSCPKCGDSIVYNGNYYCISWLEPDGKRKWALPSPTPKKYRDLYLRCYVNLMKMREMEPSENAIEAIDKGWD